VTAKPLAIASRYGELGYAVFPCHSILDEKCTCGKKACKSPGKHPLTVNGVKDATVDPGQITKWWTEHPTANIAIATGKISGITVLDVDLKSRGLESLEAIQSKYGKFPDTPLVLTGGGGFHYYFRYVNLPNKANAFKEYPGLDIRSNGGYVIAPYSNHISGRAYEWEAESTLTKVPLASFPEALLGLFREQSELKEEEDTPGVDVEAVFEGIPKGQRDQEIFRYACRLRAQDRDRNEAEVLILAAADRCSPPFPHKEAAEKLASAWKYPPSPDLVAELTEDTIAPLITQDERTVTIEWTAKQVRAVAKTLKEHSDGRITGQLTLTSTLGGKSRPLRSALFNFAALRSRTSLVKDLQSKMPGLNWDTMVEYLCAIVTEHVQGGAQVEIVTPEDDVKPNEYMLWPFLVKDHPIIIFGQEGTGKSYLALFLANIALSNSPVAKKLGLRVDSVPQHLLYLDWEGTVDVLRERTAKLAAGMMLENVPIMYRPCGRSLFSDIDAIKAVLPHKPDLVIIDSLILACGGDAVDARSVGEFFMALHSFGCTSLLIGHSPKHTAGTSASSVFGSSVFQFLARSIWEIRTDQEEHGDVIKVGLVHKKINYGPRERPVGFDITFKDDMTLITPGDLSSMPSVDSARPLSFRVLSYLREQGKSTTRDIAEALDAPQNHVRSNLSRLVKRDKVIKMDNKHWAALVTEDDPW